MSEQTQKITPTPWVQVVLHPTTILSASQRSDECFEIVPDLVFVRANPEAARLFAEATAARIVQAVNAHEKLTKMLADLEHAASAHLAASDGSEREWLLEEMQAARTLVGEIRRSALTLAQGGGE